MEKLFLRLVVIASLGSCADWNESWYIVLANDAFNRGNYQDALQTYWNMKTKGVGVQRMMYNIGCVYRALGETDSAEQIWEGVDAARDQDLLFRLAYNRGNLAFEKGDFRKAYQFFRQALTLQPNDVNSKHNLELSLQRLQGVLNTSSASRGNQDSQVESRMRQEAEIVLDFIKRLEGSQWQSQNIQNERQGFSDW